MKYSREYILRRAFDVFMVKGYDSASISVLQDQLGMSRGAMYRYFKNKEELFISVMDEYFFNLFRRLSKSIDEDVTLPAYIEMIHRRQKLVLGTFRRAGVTHTIFMNYTALVIQAVKHYPAFLTRFKDINSQLIENWRTAIQNSIDAGQVRPDVNIEILARLFNTASVKESSDNDYDESRFTIGIEADMNKRKEILDYLYSLIKIN